MFYRLTKLFAASLLIGSLSSSAIAKEADTSPSTPLSWKSYFFTMTFSGFPVRTDMQNKAYPGESIYVASEKVGDTALTCIMNKFRATVEVKPTDFEGIITGSKTSRRANAREVDFYVNDKKVADGKWTYVPKLKVILSSKKSDSLRLYNAAVRGDNVALKVSGISKVELSLPEPNEEFVNFGGDCGIGPHAK
ncbi:hypothetical protein [Litorimonas haliclonae]|uniref:hypothetical protein n=1 Tax=Litorimonas haliclonae TaxID=2081977 RepID=UPI0039EFF5DB